MNLKTTSTYLVQRALKSPGIMFKNSFVLAKRASPHRTELTKHVRYEIFLFYLFCMLQCKEKQIPGVQFNCIHNTLFVVYAICSLH